MVDARGIEVSVPGGEWLRLRHLVLDLNGTLALEGRLLPGVRDGIEALRGALEIHLLTADTFGRARAVAASLGVPATVLPAGEAGGPAKERFVRELGAAFVAAMGNGVNDAAMLRSSALGICVLGPEGCAPGTLLAARVVVRSPADGLRLLLNPSLLAATLRP